MVTELEQPSQRAHDDMKSWGLSFLKGRFTGCGCGRWDWRGGLEGSGHPAAA